MQEAPQARCPWSILAWPLCPRYLRDCALYCGARPFGGQPERVAVGFARHRPFYCRSPELRTFCCFVGFAQKAQKRRSSGPARTVLLPESLWVAPSAAPVALVKANGALSRRAQRLCATPRGCVNAEKFGAGRGETAGSFAGIGLRGSAVRPARRLQKTGAVWLVANRPRARRRLDPRSGTQNSRTNASVRPSFALCIASSMSAMTSMASWGLTGNALPSRIAAASARYRSA